MKITPKIELIKGDRQLFLDVYSTFFNYLIKDTAFSERIKKENPDACRDYFI